MSSTLLLPLVRDGAVLAVVVCERRATSGFDDQALETATGAVDGLVTALAGIDGPLPVAAPSGR
jgi:hypothetical protein